MKNLVFKVVDWDKAETISYDSKEIAEFIIVSKVYMKHIWKDKIQQDLKDHAESYQIQIDELVKDLNKLRIDQELKITLNKEYKYYIKVRVVKTNLAGQIECLKDGIRMNPYYTE